MTILWFQYFQLLCLIIAIIFRKRLSNYNIIAFIPLLLIVVIIEFAGVNFRYFDWSDNYFIYNIYLLSSTPIVLYLYKQMLALDSKTKIVFIAISIFIMTLIVINYLFLQGTKQLNTHSIILIEIMNIILSCFVLVQLVFKDDIERSLFNEPYFWINVGSLFFSLGTLVVMGLQQYIRANHIQLNKVSAYFFIMPFLNVILYSSWSYGFILCKRKPL